MKLSEIVKAINTDKLEKDIDQENTGLFIGLAKVTGPQNVNFNGIVQGDAKLIAVMIANLMLEHDDFREAVQKATELYFRNRKEQRDG